MDNSLGKHSSNSQRKTEFLSSLLKIYHNIKGLLIAWFVLTEKEKFAAGVYIGRKGEDE